MEVENTSGQRATSVVPEEVKGWNWGAFFLNWFWAIGNRVWIGLLGLVLGIIMSIILGIKGNEWAWQNRPWESVAQFKRTQRIWAWWGLAVFLAQLIIPFALIFPVMQRVRAQAKISQCMTNMHQIGLSVQMFKNDNRYYPEFIAGPALGGKPLDKSSGMDATGRAVSVYPEYIRNVSALHCPSSGVAGNYSLSDTVPDPMFNVLKGLGAESDRARKQFALYPYDSYDYQKPGNNPRGEAHYCTYWANYHPDDRDPDVERQLRWRNPPGDTVVTWCSYHRDLDSSGKPKPGSIDLVLFLDGRVERVPTEKVIEWTKAWKNARPARPEY